MIFFHHIITLNPCLSCCCPDLQSISYLEKSFQYGFVVAVEEDRDFDPIRKKAEYIELINFFKPKKSNPFDWIFKKKKSQ